MLALLGGLKFARPLVALSVAGILAIAATFTLFTERMHDRTFLNSKYEAFLQAAVDAQASGSSTLVVLDAPPEVLDFLEQEPRFASAKGHYIRLRELSGASDLLARIAQEKPDTIVLGFFHSTDRELPALIQRTHPVLMERVDLVEGQVMRFVRQGEADHRHSLGPFQGPRNTDHRLECGRTAHGQRQHRRNRLGPERSRIRDVV
ncbi:MAG: hypothetical protein IPK99_11530 [Flavobacteriales bacterium]|nr:hypothetical protein [Flavobacteriales bacterium]